LAIDPAAAAFNTSALQEILKGGILLAQKAAARDQDDAFAFSISPKPSDLPVLWTVLKAIIKIHSHEDSILIG
jgi:hypothetical protein